MGEGRKLRTIPGMIVVDLQLHRLRQTVYSTLLVRGLLSIDRGFLVYVPLRHSFHYLYKLLLFAIT